MKSLTAALISSNRAHINSVSEWLPEAAQKRSRCNYGIPANVLPILNKSLDNQPIHTDVLAAVASEFNRPVRYLEIGVSVGKNFTALASILKNSTLVGIDWESPGPVLEQVLVRTSRVGSRIVDYVAGSNTVRYVQGDEFEVDTWRSISGLKFDIILSDACHHAGALLAEYRMLNTFELLNKDRFFLMWDDLTQNEQSAINLAYNAICADLRKSISVAPLHFGVIPLNGWLGQNESVHQVGFATNLDITASSLLRTLAELGGDRPRI